MGYGLNGGDLPIESDKWPLWEGDEGGRDPGAVVERRGSEIDISIYL